MEQRSHKKTMGLRLVAADSGREEAQEVEEAARRGCPPTVFVVEDDAEFGRLLRRILRPLDVPIRVFASAEEFLASFEASTPGCLLLDLRLPGMDGISLFATVRHLGSTMPAVFLTGFADVSTVRRALLAGATDFLEKPVEAARLIAAVTTALDVARERRRSAALGARLGSLTTREWEVLRCVVAGKPNKIISSDLGISQKTVEAHRARLMAKAGARSVAELMRILGAFEGLPLASRAS